MRFIQKLFSLLLVMGCLGQSLHAQQAEIELSSLGVRSLLMQGQKAMSSLSIKIPDYLSSDSVQLRLNFTRSEVLNTNRSMLTVIMNGTPLRSAKIEKENDFGWTIPINNGAKEGVISLQLLAQLAINENPCEDIGSSGLWIRLLENSTLIADSVNKEVGVSFIANSFNSKQAIIVPRILQVQQHPAVAKLAFAVRNLSGNKLPIYFDNDPIVANLTNYVYVGLEDQIPNDISSKLSFMANLKAGRIELLEWETQDSLSPKKYNVLVVSGVSDLALNKAVNQILDKKTIQGNYSKRAIASESEAAKNANDVALNPYITFTELGTEKLPLGGLGSSTASLQFKRADVVYPCTNIEIRLEGHFSGLGSKDRAFLNLYLNEQLIQTSQLTNSGYVELIAKVRMVELLSTNALRYEFLYLPNKVDCESLANMFVAQIDPDQSGIIFPNNAENKPATFNYFPENFYSEDVSIIYSPEFGLKSVESIAETIGLLNDSRGLKSWLIPNIINTREARPKDHSSNNRIYLLSTADSSFFNQSGAVLNRVGDKYTLKDGNRDRFTALIDAELALGQIYETSGEIVMSLIADPVSNPNGILDLLSRLGDDLSLDGVDILTSRGVNHRFISSSTKVEESLQTGRFQIVTFWSKYGLPLSILIVMILAVGFYFMSKRMKLEQGDF